MRASGPSAASAITRSAQRSPLSSPSSLPASPGNGASIDSIALACARRWSMTRLRATVNSQVVKRAVAT